jgi:hypothetical protein
MTDFSQAPIEGMETCPEIFIDGYQGVSAGHGIVKLNFFSEMLDPNLGTIRRVPACRLTLSIVNLVSIHTALGELLSSFDRDGLIVRAETAKAGK